MSALSGDSILMPCSGNAVRGSGSGSGSEGSSPGVLVGELGLMGSEIEIGLGVKCH